MRKGRDGAGSKPRFLICAILVAVFGLTLLAGCGGNNSAGQAVPTDKSASSYAVDFKFACVDQIDYMKANQLSNYLQSYQTGTPVDSAMQSIINSTTFGNTVALYIKGGDNLGARYNFAPTSNRRQPNGDSTVFGFESAALPSTAGVPYVAISGALRVGTSDLEHGDGSVLPSGDRTACLAQTSFWPTSSPQVQSLAGEITGTMTDASRKVNALYRWVRENLEYGGPVGPRYGTLQVLSQRFGRCWDKSDVFVTLARASGVPAREVAGWLADANSGHVWAQVYVDGKGWIGIDTTSDVTGTGANYVPFFVTTDGAMPILYAKMPTVEKK